jgi:L-threonylcarbamoyladenylate synthase
VLRAFDRDGCTTIVACLPPEHGLGLALADRLRKAAGPRPA